MIVSRSSYGIWETVIPAVLNIINPKAAPPIQMPQEESNTALYVVGGLAGLALVGGLVYVAVKS